MVIRAGSGCARPPDGNSIFGQVTNPPSVRNVTVRNGQLQSLGAVQRCCAPALTVFEYGDLPSSTQWNLEHRSHAGGDVGEHQCVGQHSFSTLGTVNLNAIDFESAFLQQIRTRRSRQHDSGATAVLSDQMRAFRVAAASAAGRPQLEDVHSLQLAFNRRFSNGPVWIQRHDRS
jgi:hypothetical protein